MRSASTGYVLTSSRNCRPCTARVSLCALYRTPSPPDVRTLRHPPRPCRNGVSRNDVLALSQLLNIVELPLRNSWHMAMLISYATLLPELDEPLSHGVADR